MTYKVYSFRRPVINVIAGLTLIGLANGQEPAAVDPGIEVSYALIFPDEKAPETVKPEEENPFVAITELEEEDVSNSEENKIKELILAMKVVGASLRPQGYRVQLGDMILQAGMVVPPFMPDQTVQLRVNSITEDQIEFVWMEKTKTGLPPRTLLMPIKMKPSVRYAMPGQSGRGPSEGSPVMGERASMRVEQEPAPVEPKKAVSIDDSNEEEPATPKSAVRKKSAADAVLDMFFNQGGGVPTPK
jgi:nucleoid-associated protein YgaU